MYFYIHLVHITTKSENQYLIDVYQPFKKKIGTYHHHHYSTPPPLRTPHAPHYGTPHAPPPPNKMIDPRLHCSVVSLITPAFMRECTNEILSSSDYDRGSVMGKLKKCLHGLHKNQKSDMAAIIHAMKSKGVKYPYPPEAMARVLQKEGVLMSDYTRWYHVYNSSNYIKMFVEGQIKNHAFTLIQALEFCRDISHYIMERLQRDSKTNARTFYEFTFKRENLIPTPERKPVNPPQHRGTLQRNAG